MSAELFHIYGPFSIQWYGVMIVIGLSLFLLCASRHPLRKKYLSQEQFIAIVVHSIIAGIVGGRLLYLISEWSPQPQSNFIAASLMEQMYYFLAIWEGGFSILGTVIAIALYLTYYLRKHHIAAMPVLDLVALYAPLLQSVARLGCFFAGCCYGTITYAWWGLTCHDISMVEYGQRLHPTQLYSAISLLLIFFIMRFILYKKPNIQGQIISTYLILIGLERFMVDFWRSERVMIIFLNLSTDQCLALTLVCTGIISYVYCSYIQPKPYEHF